MKRIFSVKVLALGVISLAAACSTPQKPPELAAFEKLRADPQAKQAEAVAPAIMKRADRLMADSQTHWKDNDLDDARHDALYGQAKVKHAIALLQQAQAKERVKKTKVSRTKADDEAGRLETQLKALQEQVALLEQLNSQKQERAQLTSELQKQRESATAEKQTLSQKLETVDKVKAAELAVKEADTVDAKRLASSQYQAALDMLARAQQELKNEQLDAARISADMARQRAAAATEAARPAYTKEVEGNDRRKQADELAGDAAKIPGVEVRREARGQLQRLVVHVPGKNLFKGTATSLLPTGSSSLEGLAAVIKKYPNFPVQVVGHTDSRGKPDALLARAHARAQAVYNSLVSHGVAPDRLVVSGQGGAEPITDNRNNTGRARNNRVEVVFLYQ